MLLVRPPHIFECKGRLSKSPKSQAHEISYMGQHGDDPIPQYVKLQFNQQTNVRRPHRYYTDLEINSFICYSKRHGRRPNL